MFHLTSVRLLDMTNYPDTIDTNKEYWRLEQKKMLTVNEVEVDFKKDYDFNTDVNGDGILTLTIDQSMFNVTIQPIMRLINYLTV